jgi:hypothetical protein
MSCSREYLQPIDPADKGQLPFANVGIVTRTTSTREIYEKYSINMLDLILNTMASSVA